MGTTLNDQTGSAGTQSPTRVDCPARTTDTHGKPCWITWAGMQTRAQIHTQGFRLSIQVSRNWWSVVSTTLANTTRPSPGSMPGSRKWAASGSQQQGLPPQRCGTPGKSECCDCRRKAQGIGSETDTDPSPAPSVTGRLTDPPQAFRRLALRLVHVDPSKGSACMVTCHWPSPVERITGGTCHLPRCRQPSSQQRPPR